MFWGTIVNSFLLLSDSYKFNEITTNSMIQEQYQAAIKFAGEKHKNQLVPGSDANYLLHLSNVAMEILLAFQNEATFDLGTAVQLALLHDTIEDTDTTAEELKNQFGSRIAEGVSALTKDETLPTKRAKMEDSLNRILDTYLEVRLVKIADRITNLQSPPAHWTNEKIKAYGEEAQLIYDRLSGGNVYLDQRLIKKLLDYKEYRN